MQTVIEDLLATFRFNEEENSELLPVDKDGLCSARCLTSIVVIKIQPGGPCKRYASLRQPDSAVQVCINFNAVADGMDLSVRFLEKSMARKIGLKGGVTSESERRTGDVHWRTMAKGADRHKPRQFHQVYSTWAVQA